MNGYIKVFDDINSVRGVLQVILLSKEKQIYLNLYAYKSSVRSMKRRSQYIMGAMDYNSLYQCSMYASKEVSKYLLESYSVFLFAT